MLDEYIMASSNHFMFDSTTRIGDDSCDLSQRNIQNAEAATYMLSNFRPECPMKDAVALATSQPNVNFTGSHRVGIGGCNIDSDSALTISELSMPKCRISLWQRPFATVPYLGRGSSNPVLESHLQQGELANNKKSISGISESSCLGHSNTPLIPSLEATISNPANLVEGVAAEGWVRGGLPSRELTRDSDYARAHTETQYV